MRGTPRGILGVMRALLLVMLATFGWGCQTAVAPPSQAAIPEPPASPPWPPPLVNFDHMGTTIEDGTTYHYAEFRMTNVSRGPVYYFGYEEYPFFQVASRSADVWTLHPIYRCGTGTELHEIPAGGVKTFRVSDWEWSGDAFRACVDFRASRNFSAKPAVVWSDGAPTHP
jgi:hypothetical protein